MIAFGTVLVLLVMAGLTWAAGAGSGLLRLRALVQASWRQVASELQRRQELIPDLIAICDPAGGQAGTAVAQVQQARDAARIPQLPIARRAAAEADLVAALDRLFAQVGTGADRDAEDGFGALRDELEGIRQRVIGAGRLYNLHRRELERRAGSRPRRVLARVLGVTPPEPFQVPEGSRAPDGFDLPEAQPASEPVPTDEPASS